MAVSSRQQFPAILMMIAGMIHFAPALTPELRSLGTTGFWIAAMIWNFAFSPTPQAVDQPPRIIWDERDEGEKFSIVMFHLLICTVALFMAYQIILSAYAPDGSRWIIGAAMAIVASTSWLIWSNWKNRNAR
jgi:hypothetical protein